MERYPWITIVHSANDLAERTLSYCEYSVWCRVIGRHHPDELKDSTEPVVISAEDKQRIAVFRKILEDGQQPTDNADAVFDGIRSDRLYILSHDHFDDMIRQRAENIIQGNNPVLGESGLTALADPD